MIVDALNLKPVILTHSNKLENAYELVDDFPYEHNGKVRWVPKFFQYDGASIPTLAYHMVGTPFNPRYMKAALVHDWLYHTHEIERAAADELFYSMLCESGVGDAKAKIMRLAVELFGRWYWHNDDADQAYKKELEELIRQDGRNPSVYGL
ncbi:hypothetical protein N483_15680 [Pseudoalteromonas luteoviolacea NCIMB 1944]|uniref:DUF1353 domain-containing protein n=1 Tax=Pseudoalteromonas luteoviolacea (strain 2ta16) TaxID=1353533 RepID=V4J769_PSEL2|nr:DUF1353 domain-containing protein [Pseudoalteromonas sp. Of7M-16]ESP91132.1 protein of unknown function (DUF1353) [Pseudoalteromonas luteoviolacea 2ta16]KZN41335.1 hypothetical protein N483_15680 [Pseudoalteromonas luteoviolacea NCIMB 1944]